MSQNQNNKNQIKKQKSTQPQKAMGLFELTKHQLAMDINKYENAIADDNTVFKSKLTDSHGNPIVFKKRLNSLDSTMLEEAAYNVLDNEELKLEKKIENVKSDIKEIDEKIIVAQTINDEISLKKLYLQKKLLTQNLETLNLEYKTQATEVKLTSVISNILDFPQKLNQNMLTNIKHFIRNSEIFKHIRPLMRSFLIRDTIYKLNKINQSVDELVKMQVPFGEQDARYATLVNHLAHAGTLHSQILKEFDS